MPTNAFLKPRGGEVADTGYVEFFEGRGAASTGGSASDNARL
jgi:hypothetical protein